MAGERLIVSVNGTVSLDTQVPRFYGPVVGGLPINVGFVLTPSGSPTFAVDQFYSGVALPTLAKFDVTSAFGSILNGCTPAVANCTGG